MTKLQMIIKERGLKQGYIAEKVGISKSAFSLIVNGKSIPTLPVAIKIARALDLTVEEIWGDIIE